MYQVLIQEYGTDTPKGITIRTTPELETFLHNIEMKSLVYLEIRYVRSLKLSAITGQIRVVQKNQSTG